MAAGEETVGRLRAAIGELAAADAADVLLEARHEARTRVRSILSDALAASMLDSLCDELDRPLRRDRPGTAVPEAVEVVEEATPAVDAGGPVRDEAARRVDEAGPALDEAGGEIGWYVYGVLAAPEAAAAGADLTILPEGPVAAVAARVPLAEFGERQLRAHLADMEWVERTARAHEAVLDDLCSRATVIPMRMCTVYRTEGGVREMLRRETPALVNALDVLEGKTEWGVKVFTDPERGLRAATEESQEVSDAGPGSGAAYMQRRQRAREHAERAAQLVEQAVGEIHERLCAASADGLVAPPHRPQASGRSAEMALNGVYLVADDAREQFHQEVDSLQREFESLGLELELTGPWPAYNFVPGTIGAAW